MHCTKCTVGQSNGDPMTDFLSSTAIVMLAMEPIIICLFLVGFWLALWYVYNMTSFIHEMQNN